MCKNESAKMFLEKIRRSQDHPLQKGLGVFRGSVKNETAVVGRCARVRHARVCDEPIRLPG